MRMIGHEIALARHRLRGGMGGLAVIAAALAFIGTLQIATVNEAHARADWSMQANVSGVYGGSRMMKLPSATKAKRRKARGYRAKRKSYKKRRYSKAAKIRNKSVAKKAKSYKVAALDKTFDVAPQPKTSLTGGGVRWIASASCLDPRLKAIVYAVASNYGHVTVNSTCRSRKHNRRVGGARRSQHLTGSAVDFRVRGNHRAAYAYLRSNSAVGGFKHYGGGLFHIDTGPRRTW